jgi:hypothetical protein
MNTTRMLYMPIPMQLAGMPFLGKDGQPILDPGSKYGRGFVPQNPLGPTGGEYYGSRNLKDEIDPSVGLRQANYYGLQEINQNNIGASFQRLLNEATSNPARFTPGYTGGTSGHHPVADQLLGIFNKGGPSIGFEDDTGSVQLTPGGLNLQSNKGWSAGFNPTGGNINVGPVGVQGTWAGDKSIQATFGFGTPKEKRVNNPVMMQQFLQETNPVVLPQRTFTAYDLDTYQQGKDTKLKEEQTSMPYSGFGLEGIGPLTPQGQRFGVLLEQPQTEARKLMEQQTEDYIRRNPGYRYQ